MSDLNREQLLDGVSYADEWIRYQQRALGVPGVVVAIHQGDDLLLNQGYGHANLESQTPMSPDRIFRVASHSKTFTATAIMQLVEAGKLRLDDRLSQYIPWMPDSLRDVTVRQALNHASGITRDGTDSDHWQLHHAFPDEEALRALVEDGGAVLPNNQHFKYSNIAYSLLGLVIEKASAQPYNEYVKREIVDRLGLQNTGPETTPEVQPRLVTGYTNRRHPFPRVPIPDISTHAMAAATGFYSTAADMATYFSAHHFGNDTLISDPAKREMQQPYWTVDERDPQGHYGLGFSILKIGERKVAGHGGGFPGHSTRTIFDPQDRLTVIVLTNESGGPAEMLARGIVKILNFALAQPEATPEERARNSTFVGRFVSTWGVQDIALFGKTLIITSPDLEDPVNNPTKLEIVDDDTLKIGETNGYGSPGELIRFTRDNQGGILRVRSAGGTAYPIDLYPGHTFTAEETSSAN